MIRLRKSDKLTDSSLDKSSALRSSCLIERCKSAILPYPRLRRGALIPGSHPWSLTFNIGTSAGFAERKAVILALSFKRPCHNRTKHSQPLPLDVRFNSLEQVYCLLFFSSPSHRSRNIRRIPSVHIASVQNKQGGHVLVELLSALSSAPQTRSA